MEYGLNDEGLFETKEEIITRRAEERHGVHVSNDDQTKGSSRSIQLDILLYSCEQRIATLDDTISSNVSLEQQSFEPFVMLPSKQ